MTEYMKRLDRTKDFGQYCPPDQGAFYNQDGFDFDHEGRIVEARLTQEQRERLKKKPPAAKPAAQKQDQDPKAPETGSSDSGDRDTGSGGDEDGINLEEWLRDGLDSYPFPDVQKTVRSRFSIWKTSKRDLIEFLVEDQKVISHDDLADDMKALIA